MPLFLQALKSGKILIIQEYINKQIKMKNLNVTEEAVKQAYKNADENGKQVLTDLFGKQVELYSSVTERVRSFEDACQILGISTNVPDVQGLPRKHQKAIVANYKLIIIAEALNEGWEPNWQGTYELKYYPKFDITSPDGARYLDTYHSAGYANNLVGSQLFFKTIELATYFGKQFTDLHNYLMLLNY